MSSAAVTYSFTNGVSPIDAVQVNQNYTDLVSIFNSHALHKDAGALSDSSWLADGVVTAAKLAAQLPRGMLDRKETTGASSTANSSTFVDWGNTVTFTAAADRAYRIEAWAPEYRGSAVNGMLGFAIRESTTTHAFCPSMRMTIAGALEGPLYVARVMAFSAAAHTLKISLNLFAGTGTVNLEGGSSPAWIAVSDVGPSSIL